MTRKILVLAAIMAALPVCGHAQGRRNATPAATSGKVVDFYIPVGDCTGEPAQMIAEHGKFWGFKVPANTYKFNEDMYEKLVDYYTCMGVAQRNGDACAPIPKLPEDPTYMRQFLPADLCRNNVVRIVYMTGKVTDESFCVKNSRLEASVPIQEYCKVAKDLASVCSNSQAVMGQKATPECYKVFPRNTADCDRDRDCQKVSRIYGAIKKGSSASLPLTERVIYSAYTSGDTGVCKELLASASQEYCKTRREYIEMMSVPGTSRPPAQGTMSAPLPPLQKCATCQVYRDQAAPAVKKKAKKAAKAPAASN